MLRRVAGICLVQSASSASRLRASSTAGGADDTIDLATQPRSRPRPLGRARHETNVADAERIADRVKSMSDAEWEAVPTKDKSAFNAFIAHQLKTHPTRVSEQQRRRYYETTLHDPLREDPSSTVVDTAERIRLGLPTNVVTSRRQLGVSDPMYQRGSAALFDPNDAQRIEHAVTELKQMFTDYVDRKKAGLSTESQRRALAKASEDLNYQTQLHLASMFKHAEARVQEVLIDERMKQLRKVAAVRNAMRKAQRRRGGATAEGADASPMVGQDQQQPVQASAKRKKLRRNKRKSKASGSAATAEDPVATKLRSAAVKRTLRDAYGLDVDTARAVWEQIQAQEKFLRLCEVMARLTVGRGFHHSAEDESLDEYAQALRKVYSSDPQSLGSIDAVQYLAATEGVAPVDWASRWYQKLLMVPLQATPEFKELQRIEEEERDIAKAAGTLPGTSAAPSSAEGGEPASAAPPSLPEPGAQAVGAASSLVEKMFLPPGDERLKSLHEKRLRYIAFVHMESQLKRLRKNARLFDGAEESEEAVRCRELYEKITARKAEIASSRADDGASPAADGSTNPYAEDAEMRAWFEEIRDICNAFIDTRVAASAEDRKAERAARIAASLEAGKPEALAIELRQIRREKKRAQVSRMLRLLERDVRDDIVWAKNMQEADRPAPLPIPEPMSYVSAADTLHWRGIYEKDKAERSNPFAKVPPSGLKASLFGQPWDVPSKPMLFWGTGANAVQEALKHAAEEAEAKRSSRTALPPPYPCAENPWGWRLKKDILDDDTAL
jgi:hypothetical protein